MCSRWHACTTLQIRTASNTAHEREERTLYVLERDVKDREARLASRERLLSERENRVRGCAGWGPEGRIAAVAPAWCFTKGVTPCVLPGVSHLVFYQGCHTLRSTRGVTPCVLPGVSHLAFYQGCYTLRFTRGVTPFVAWTV